MPGAVGRRLDEGRLHFQHGPIDLIITLEGPADAVDRAARDAWERFQTILGELAGELDALRRPLGPGTSGLTGKVALAMEAACRPHADRFVTPMAAVAGAVADEILAAMKPSPPLRRAMINNGGDIAFYLSEGETVTIGLAARPEDLALAGTITVHCFDPTRGVATSGWRGRSQSLGIADAATVLASNAANADAAATMIANAVNVDHPAITRRPARDVKDDSDLGALPVTVAVGLLPGQAVAAALDAGERRAMHLLQAGLIHGAVLLLQGQIRVIGTPEHRQERVPQSCP